MNVRILVGWLPCLLQSTKRSHPLLCILHSQTNGEVQRFHVEMQLNILEDCLQSWKKALHAYRKYESQDSSERT